MISIDLAIGNQIFLQGDRDHEFILVNNQGIVLLIRVVNFRNDKSFRKVTEEGYVFESKRFPILKPLIILGRVPLFFYILHLWLIHFSAILLALPNYGFKAVTLPYLLSSAMPDDYGYDLHHVYVLWLVMVAILYPICNWFTNYKSKHKYWWLNYL
ncbi:hypothetical protein STA3757_35280 [Stanieria sp. NIES-3757]|nr:hypothetical protein STA3757_35280 [Stanieria sp. NIES-3757]